MIGCDHLNASPISAGIPKTLGSIRRGGSLFLGRAHLSCPVALTKDRDARWMPGWILDGPSEKGLAESLEALLKTLVAGGSRPHYLQLWRPAA
jgi:hypothetical protein